MRYLVAACLLFISLLSNSQVIDNFSDGNFNANPVWSGDDSLFQVNGSLMLQSKGSTGTSKDISLSTSSTVIDSAIWQCWVRFNLSPSTQNFCRFYLTSDQQDLKGNLNGYYILFGGITGSTDSIALFKQKGNIHTRIIGGRPSTVSKTNNVVRIKVLRDKTGNWQLFSDTLGGNNFAGEGTGFDNEFLSSVYSGYFVRFTSTNITNYYMDDVMMGPITIDNTPLKADTVTYLSQTILRVIFSEDADATTALNASNYSVNNGIGTASNISFESGSNSIVLVQFSNSFINGNNYTLTVSGIKDLNNNTLTSQNIPFTFFIPQKEDVLISEFFPDPTPPLGLPEQEFIELYNRTSYPINLNGWTISDGVTTSVLPNTDIKPDSFIIICSTGNIPLFSSFGKTAAVSSFPSLNNSGDLILLKDKNGAVIHQLNYDMSWYTDNTRENGGWTIEMKNPFDLCKGKINFAASNNSSGGTPGKENSLWTKTPDTTLPLLPTVKSVSATSLILTFNEKMDSASLLNAGISISNGITIVSKSVRGELHDSLELQVSPLTGNVSYTLTINNARDCNLNTILTNTSKGFIYFMPDTAKTFDIVINEIFADPDPVVGLPAYEFIELYNKSNRIISLKNWTIEDATSIAKLPDILLLPDSFLIVTSNTGYTSFAAFTTATGLTNFPSLGNDVDELVLKNEKGQIIHSINYTSDWYNDNLKKNGGWTLEMIDPENPCGNKANWNASSNSKGGTPGKRNSVNAINRDHIAPKLLSAYPLNNKSLKLTFNETLDTTSILSSGFLYVNPLGKASSVKLQPYVYSTVIASFIDSFQTKNVYRIIADSIKDCAGNVIADFNYTDFGLPENADSNDIVINEILFNPRSGGVDFVELYNKTEKIIDLGKLFIANTNPDNSVNDLYPIASEGFLFFPKTYCALTSNSEILKQQYYSPNTINFIQCTLPSFSDNEGTALVIDASGKRYDQFTYDDKMHYPLLDDKGGVSLERIDFNRPTNERTNWTSASMALMATPAYRNSQFAEGNANGEHLKVEPEVFSPDGDGYKDIVNFSYTMDEGGYTGNLFLYDSRGVMVKQLLKNEILGTSGTFSWNGITDKNEKVALGIYIVYFEVFNLKGDIKNYRSTVVVGGKL